MPGRFRLAPLLLVVATMGAAPALAQVQRAPREFRGLFGGSRAAPGQSRTSLSLTFTAMGGYDDAVLGSQGATPTPTPQQMTASGYNGLGLAELLFRHGTEDRHVEASGLGAVNVYSVANAGTSKNVRGGLRAQTRLARRSTLRASVGAGYQDYFTLAAVPIVLGPDQTAPPPTSADFAVADRRLVDLRAGADLDHGWNRSHSTALRYTFDRVDYDAAPPAAGGIRYLYLGDSWRQRGAVEHTVAFSRQASLLGSYSYSVSEMDREDGTIRPMDEQRIEVTARYEKRVSPRRTLVLEAGAGGSLMDTVDDATRQPVEYWSTIGHALARIDIGRSWSAQALYQRGYELRQGFNEPFFTDQVRATLGGFIGRRFDLVFQGGYATGVLGLASTRAGGNPYRSRDGSVQARFALASSAALVASYVRYYYEFDHPDLLPAGFARRNDRQVARVGLTFWLPLLGSWRQPGGTAAPAAGMEN